MNKIKQILQIKSIDGAKQIKQMINRWSNVEIIQFYKELKKIDALAWWHSLTEGQQATYEVRTFGTDEVTENDDIILKLYDEHYN